MVNKKLINAIQLSFTNHVIFAPRIANFTLKYKFLLQFLPRLMFWKGFICFRNSRSHLDWWILLNSYLLEFFQD